MVRIYGNMTEKTEDEEWTAVLGKIKESIDKSLVSVSVKSGTYLETEKLKAKVGNVQEEIHNPVSYTHLDVYKRQLIRFHITDIYII